MSAEKCVLPAYRPIEQWRRFVDVRVEASGRRLVFPSVLNYNQSYLIFF
jgi:hypothetical protein